MQRGTLLLGAALWLLGSAGYGAAPAAAWGAAADWDDAHMASRYESLLSAPTPPADVRGSSRYGAIADGTAATVTREVPAGLSFTTQRSWQSGPTSAASPPPSSTTFSLPPLTAGRHTGGHGGRSSNGSPSRGGIR